MGGVWFYVLVFSTIGYQFVESRNCTEETLENVKNCDECIRCGGTWCMNNIHIRCTSNPTDDWCTARYEPYSQIVTPEPADEEDIFEPRHHQRIVSVLSRDFAEFITLTNPEKIDITVVNSSIETVTSLGKYIDVTQKVTKKKTEEYVITVMSTPQTDFCPAKGRVQESITLQLEIPKSKKHATITYQVPCACDYTEVNSLTCNMKGNYSRGICSCQKGWKGEYCETKESHCERGDIGFCRNPFTDELCSGNGICNCEGVCDCDLSKEGSQYFDNYCSDICMSTGYCDSCLLNHGLGQCDDCQNIYVDPLNKTVLNNTDEIGRKVWIECLEKADTCSVKYVAMKDEKGTTHIMILEPCNGLVAAIAGGGINVTVPVVLGVVALVAAAAAVAGYMVWKARAPPMPLSDPEYTSFDAEDCTGENPLYKPPTSSFKNPTYGKW